MPLAADIEPPVNLIRFVPVMATKDPPAQVVAGAGEPTITRSPGRVSAYGDPVERSVIGCGDCGSQPGSIPQKGCRLGQKLWQP